MTDDDPPRLRVPLDWVLVDAIGAIIAGVGVFGLTGGGASMHPLLGNPAVAVGCIVIGVGLMGVALVRILRHMRASAGQPRR
jgi:hypothetical protein